MHDISAPTPPEFEIFCVATPGLEAPLSDEITALGWAPEPQPGGIAFRGGWPDVWRAHLWLRGATRILVRVASFRALHVAQLDKRARKLPWAEWLRPEIPVRVEASCHKSRIYHQGAAAQRVAGALTAAGFCVEPAAPVSIKARIEDDLVTISLDATGESLHKRGHKPAIAKAPMRETMAAMFLAQAGFRGTEPVFDPMCGSGTFVLEAAEIALGRMAGRSRDFAFMQFASFAPDAFAALRAQTPAPVTLPEGVRFIGRDRDQGAVRMARINAAEAGLEDNVSFETGAVADLTRPEGPPGLVIVNPPYGARIGQKGPLIGLYRQFGEAMRAHFSGWRVAMVTSDAGLARATGLHFGQPGPYVAHGGIKIRLWQTGPLR